MNCDEWRKEICCRSLPCFQLVKRLPSVFWVKRRLMDEGGCSGILTFFIQPSLLSGRPIRWQKYLFNVTERCLRELDLSTWLLLSQFIFCTIECVAELFRHCYTTAILLWRWLALIPASHNCCNAIRSAVHLNCYRSCYHSTMTVTFRQYSG